MLNLTAGKKNVIDLFVALVHVALTAKRKKKC